MAIRIELPKELLTTAIEGSIASLKRANTKEKNQIIKDAREKEIAVLTTALNTTTEIK